MNSTPQLRSESPLRKPIKTNDETFEISLYNDCVPTKDDFLTASNRLSIAFPKMTKEFFILLTEFVIKEGFTAKRLSDAVNHVIANFQYKELNISDIIKFDRRIKLYTYYEVYNLMGQFPHPDFEKMEVNGNNYFVRKVDLLNV